MLVNLPVTAQPVSTVTTPRVVQIFASGVQLPTASNVIGLPPNACPVQINFTSMLLERLVLPALTPALLVLRL